MLREHCSSYDSEGGSAEGLLGLQGKAVQIQNVRASRPRRSEEALQRRKRRAYGRIEPFASRKNKMKSPAR